MKLSHTLLLNIPLLILCSCSHSAKTETGLTPAYQFDFGDYNIPTKYYTQSSPTEADMNFWSDLSPFSIACWKTGITSLSKPTSNVPTDRPRP